MNSNYAEEIVRARYGSNREEKDVKEAAFQVESDLEKGYVVVCYEVWKLNEVSIMGGKAMMLLPDNLTEMTEERMAAKYPDHNRPKWILSDAAGEVTMTFHMEEGETGDLEQITNLFKQELKRIHPTSLMEEEKTSGEGKGRVCWFSLNIPLMDDQCCHIVFFREMREGLLMGTFDCSRDRRKQWKSVLKQLFPTIREEIQEEADGNCIS